MTKTYWNVKALGEWYKVEVREYHDNVAHALVDQHGIDPAEIDERERIA